MVSQHLSYGENKNRSTATSTDVKIKTTLARMEATTTSPERLELKLNMQDEVHQLRTHRCTSLR